LGIRALAWKLFAFSIPNPVFLLLALCSFLVLCSFDKGGEGGIEGEKTGEEKL